MEIKYTTDGKKVVVIGNLNSQEKIVQEVFIVNGAEIPSGENFVVKSLHDSPAVSWKEQQLKKLEENYDKKTKEINREIDRLETLYREKSKLLKNKIEYAGAALKNVSPESFNTLVNYLTGKINWIVINSWTPELVEFADFKQNYEDHLRLISIYGKDDGTLTYAVGDYHDYSGSNRKFLPFENREEAVEKLKDLTLSKGVSDDTLKIASKYGFSFPQEQVLEFKNKKIATFRKNIEQYSMSIKSWENGIEEINKI